MKKLTFLVVFSLIVSTMTAQWVSDPSKNTLIAGVDTAYSYGEMAGNKNDSASYLLYYKSFLPTPLNYMLYMQKIDFRGNRKWGNDGVLISQGPNRTWVSGVALIPNQDSCIYVAYSKAAFYPGPQDTVNRIFLNKVTKSGTKLWGVEGIQVSESTAGSSYTPVLLNTEDNQVCIGYEVIDSVDSPFGPLVNLKLKKFSASGVQLWQYTLPRDAEHDNLGIILEPLSGGNIMAIYKHIHINFIDSLFNQSLVAQKFDAGGNPAFLQPKEVVTYNWYKYEPPMTSVKVESNMQNGFFIGASWDEGPVAIQTYIQQIDADANTLFPTPVPLVPDSSDNLDRTDYGMRYLPGSRELLVVWADKHTSLNNAAILGQKITLAGQRVWADTGKVIYPLISTLDSAYGYISLRKSGADESVLFFMKKINNDSQDIFSYANKYGPDGISIWGKTVLLSNHKGTVNGLKPLEEIGSQWVVSFSDFTDTAYASKAKGQLYAQNLFVDGRIGLGVMEHSNHSVPVKIYPNPTSDNLTIEFEKPICKGVKLILNNAQAQPLHWWDYIENLPKSSSVTISLKEFSAGFYLLNIQTPEGSAMVKVLISR